MLFSGVEIKSTSTQSTAILIFSNDYRSHSHGPSEVPKMFQNQTHATCSTSFLQNVVVRPSVHAGSGAHQGAPHTALRPRVSISLQGNQTTFQTSIYSRHIEIGNDSRPELASETDKELASKWTLK